MKSKFSFIDLVFCMAIAILIRHQTQSILEGMFIGFLCGIIYGILKVALESYDKE